MHYLLFYFYFLQPIDLFFFPSTLIFYRLISDILVSNTHLDALYISHIFTGLLRQLGEPLFCYFPAQIDEAILTVLITRLHIHHRVLLVNATLLCAEL